MRSISLAIAATLLCISLMAFGLYVWWLLPNVSLERQGTTAVRVHTEVLGEYPTDIGLIEIRELSSARVVWLAVPEGRMVQVHSLSLKVGSNTAEPDVFWGKVRRGDAGQGPSFNLDAGTAYAIKVCAPSVLPLCRTRNFSLG